MEGQAEQVDVPESEPASSSVGKQWRSIMDQIILTQRVINSLQRRGSLPRQGEVSVRVVPVNGDNEHSGRHPADQNLNDLPREQVAHNLSEIRPSSVKSEVANGGPIQALQSASNRSSYEYFEDTDQPATDRQLTENECEFMKSVRQALVQQFSNHGIILTLLASITFVVFLQPPGSLDTNGIVRSTTAVQCFLFFSSVSFMLACTGLLIAGIGSASLFRPEFFDFEDFAEKLLQKHTNQDESELLRQVVSSRETVVYDSVPNLCRILKKNLQRLKRLRCYMTLSFLACIAAFVSAGLAITEPSGNSRRVLIAGLCFGGLALACETVIYLSGFFQKKLGGRSTGSSIGSSSVSIKRLSLLGHKLADRVM